MKRTLGFLSVAALLATGGIAMAAGSDSSEAGSGAGNSSQSVTGTQLHNPQEGTPATGRAKTAPGSAYQRNGAAGSGVSAQSSGKYPGAVGPTGSTQPDATNPVRSNPSGGGGQSGGGQGGASGH
jgi:hypothetical protein